MATQMEMENAFGLSMSELALFEFTNNPIMRADSLKKWRYNLRQFYRKFPRQEHLYRQTVIPAKGSYIWAITIAYIVEYLLEVDEERITIGYKKAFYNTYAELGRSIYEPILDIEQYFDIQIKFFYYLYGDFLKEFNLSVQEIYPQIKDKGKLAYHSLIEKGLIKDPTGVEVLGIPFAVLGFVPYSFDTKTRRGKTVHRKIKAMFWVYEMKLAKGEKKTKIEFRLLKFLRAFKKALTDVGEDNEE